jgi:hypothetical protein
MEEFGCSPDVCINRLPYPMAEMIEFGTLARQLKGFQ